MRAASCFGAKQVWWTGNRVRLDTGERLPREERLKGYKQVEQIQFDYPFEQFPRGCTPIAIELVEDNYEWLPMMEHPEKAIYVFGPEDGSIPSVLRRHCHRFVRIPTYHCTNLAAAIYLVLYDRMFKIWQKTGEMPTLNEDRGFVDTLANEDIMTQANEGAAFK